MNNLRFATIGQKLTAGLLIIISLVLLIGVISFYTVTQLSLLTEKLYQHPYEVSNAARNIQVETMNIKLELSDILHLLEHVTSSEGDTENEYDNFNIKAAVSAIDRSENNIRRYFKIIFEKYLGDKKDIKEAFDTFASWKPIRDNVIYLLQEGKIKEAEEVLHGKGKAHTEKIDDNIHNIMDFAHNKAKILHQKALQKKDSSLILISSITLFSIFMSILVSIILTRNISHPLKQLFLITDKINQGNFDICNTKAEQSILERSDEIGTLYKSFEAIINFLILPYNDIIKSDRNLKEKTGEIRRLLNSFNEHVIASKTDTKGRIIYVSGAFSKISGFSKEELIGAMQSVIRHPDTSVDLFKELWKTIKSGKEWSGEIKNKTKNGDYFWIYAHISPDIDSNGKVVGYNAINQDITAQKELETLTHTLEDKVKEEVEKNRQQASYMLHQSRLAQMGGMISMIAHQWRQPLASITAISGTLSIDIQLDNYKKEFFEERLEAISDLALHLSSTINDFRGFFKEDKQQAEVLLDKVINASIQIIRPSFIASGITLVSDIEDGIVLKTYPNEVKQVLLNLLKNAEEALLEQGENNNTIWVKGYKRDSNAYIYIQDNAGGVPEDIISKVFDPYFSTKTKKDGTGLGLYMSKTIIEEHCQGSLTMENTDKGARFSIVLPLEALDV